MKVGIWKKDMTIIQTVLQSLDIPAPLFQASLPIYAAAMSQGLEADDTAAVFEVLERLAGKVATEKSGKASGRTRPSGSGTAPKTRKSST
jgi:hypothetical protein